MAVELLRGKVSEFAKLEAQWGEVPLLRGAVVAVKKILDNPDMFVFVDSSSSPLTEVTNLGLYPLSEVRLFFALPKDEKTGFVSNLRAVFKLCERGRAPQAKDFKATLVLELGKQGYEEKYNWGTGKTEKIPSGETHIDIPLPLNLDTSEVVINYWPERKTKPRFGKHSEDVRQEVGKIKRLTDIQPTRIECTTWSGLKGELEKAS